MARIFANPKPYSKVISRRYTKYVVILITIILLTAFLYWKVESSNIIFALFGVTLVGIFVNFSEWIFKGDSRNDQGSVGEWQVKKILETLSDDYAVFMNVPIRNNLDIDFVIVGPTGVYAVEVKSHKWFNRWGSGRKFINQTLSESLGLKQQLKRAGVELYVNGVLVFSRARVQFGFTPQQGVYVIGKDYLLSLLSKGHRVDFNRAKAEEVVKSLYHK